MQYDPPVSTSLSLQRLTFLSFLSSFLLFFPLRQANPVFTVCHEDRAFLCRGCDVAIHSANEHVAKHQRFLFQGLAIELNAIPCTSGAAPEVGAAVEQAAVVPQAAAVPAPKKVRGTKRKAVQKSDSFNSADAAVPTFAGSLDLETDNLPAQPEFNAFVQDFLGPAGKDSKGDVSMTNFLDTFFDDIPTEDDFGVVPHMGFVQ